MVFFQIMTNGTLFQPLNLTNLTNLILQNSYIIVMALGLLLVIVAGHIDLSVGSVSGFIGAVAAVLGGSSVGLFPTDFQLLSTGFIPDPFQGETIRIASVALGLLMALVLLINRVRERADRAKHGMGNEPMGFFVLINLIFTAMIAAFSYMLSSYKGLPNVLIVMLLLMFAYDFVTSQTTVGRRIYALGGNDKAARLSGINAERLTFYTFIKMGVLAALAGLIFSARLNTANPKAGLGFELDVIAACFIGGASASGGVGKVLGGGDWCLHHGLDEQRHVHHGHWH